MNRARSGDPASAPAGEALRARLATGACPDCAGKIFELGPRGGLANNVRCVRCGATFNIVRFAGRLIFAERIEAPHFRAIHGTGRLKS